MSIHMYIYIYIYIYTYTCNHMHMCITTEFRVCLRVYTSGLLQVSSELSAGPYGEGSEFVAF